MACREQTNSLNHNTAPSRSVLTSDGGNIMISKNIHRDVTVKLAQDWCSLDMERRFNRKHYQYIDVKQCSEIEITTRNKKINILK